MDDKSIDVDVDDGGGDICRVCRTESSPDRQLYHPCLCTGSIKYIHQECLTQWLKYSKKEYCELCNYKYTFKPIYHPDMPKRLPVKDLVQGLLKSLCHGLRFWIHYTLVAIAWLGIVPLSACRIYRCLFTGSVSSLLSLSLDMLSTEHIVTDCLHGAVIIIITLCAFICLVWLREQIVHGGLPAWMEPPARAGVAPAENIVPPGGAEDDNADQEEDGNDAEDDEEEAGTEQMEWIQDGPGSESDPSEYTLDESSEDDDEDDDDDDNDNDYHPAVVIKEICKGIADTVSDIRNDLMPPTPTQLPAKLVPITSNDAGAGGSDKEKQMHDPAPNDIPSSSSSMTYDDVTEDTKESFAAMSSTESSPRRTEKDIIAHAESSSLLSSVASSKSSSVMSFGFMKSAFGASGSNVVGSSSDGAQPSEGSFGNVGTASAAFSDFRSISADGFEQPHLAGYYSSNRTGTNGSHAYGRRFLAGAEDSRSDGEEDYLALQEPSTSGLSLPDLSQFEDNQPLQRFQLHSSGLASSWADALEEKTPIPANLMNGRPEVDEVVVEPDWEEEVMNGELPPDILEPLEDNVIQGQGDEAQNQAEDENWQPFEWNQAGEDLTWERLLGIDGSLAFLEHVFWVISLNTLFILVFAFSPFHIGHFAVVGFQMMPYVKATYFEGVVTTLVGYFLTAVALYICYVIFRAVRLTRIYRVIGMCYLAVKVFLLVLLDIGLFPLMCGWWLDICSLNLFAASLKDRVASFHLSPPTSMFMHWIVGMVYVFYFASFILLMREVLRPGVLWFLRNLNDPDFNPIHEMLQHPVHRHVRRFLCSSVLFGAIILLLVYVPLQVIAKIWVGVLPYKINLNMEQPLSELSLELLLLQVVLPALLEQSQARQLMKALARLWCRVVGRALGLTEYLLPAEDIPKPTTQTPHQEATEQTNPSGSTSETEQSPDGGDPTSQIVEDDHDQTSLPSTSQINSAHLTTTGPSNTAFTINNNNNHIVFNNNQHPQRPGDMLLARLLEANVQTGGQIKTTIGRDSDDDVIDRVTIGSTGVPSTINQLDDSDGDSVVAIGKQENVSNEIGELHGDQDGGSNTIGGNIQDVNNDNNVNNIDNNNNNNNNNAGNNNNDNAQQQPNGNLAAAHQALLLGHGPLGSQPYRRPPYFVVRICLLLVSMSLSLMVGSLIGLTIPVLWGRGVIHVLTGRQTTHELYTIACGLYLSWLVIRGVITVAEWIPKGWTHVCKLFRYWSLLILKCLLVGVPLLIFVPLALGILFQLIVVTPLRVPINQSPILFPTQDWALGILHCKICCAAVMMGPDWWLKAACEQLYRDGVRNLNLSAVYNNLIIPLCSILGLILAVPYAFSYTVLALQGYHLENQVLFVRHAYPCMLIVGGVVGFIVWHLKQLNRLVDHIRNDKYLVGKRLVNYDQTPTTSITSEIGGMEHSPGNGFARTGDTQVDQQPNVVQ